MNHIIFPDKTYNMSSYHLNQAEWSHQENLKEAICLVCSFKVSGFCFFTGWRRGEEKIFL